MSRLGVSVAVGVLLIGLAGCSSTPTKEEACSSATTAVEKAVNALGSGSDARAIVVERIEVSRGYVDELRGVLGPEEFVKIRDGLAGAYADMLDIAADIHADSSVSAKGAVVSGFLIDLREYCS